MELKQDTNRFYIGDPNNAQAEITYVPQENNVIAIDHTYVSSDLRGQGVAKTLLDAVVTYARENNLKIVPVCSYAVTVMNDNKDYQDILA